MPFGRPYTSGQTSRYSGASTRSRKVGTTLVLAALSRDWKDWLTTTARP